MTALHFTADVTSGLGMSLSVAIGLTIEAASADCHQPVLHNAVPWWLAPILAPVCLYNNSVTDVIKQSEGARCSTTPPSSSVLTLSHISS